jgi:tripartite ATP-independent transporter DctP family solute receptor
VLALSAAGMFAAAPALAQTKLKMAYALSTSSHYGAGAAAFAKTIEAESGGKYSIEQFPNSALGGEREVIEGLQLGTIDVAIVSTGATLNFVPSTGVFDIPFLFRNEQHAQAVMDGEVGEELLRKFSKHHMVGLAWGESGFRQLANNKRPVATPDDLKGIKLRTMEVPVHIQGFKTLGALPTPIAFPEVYTALQQGTVDAVESPTQTMLTSKFFQVQKYLSMTNHIYAASAFLASKRFIDGLSEADRKAFFQAARVGAKVMRKAVIDNEAAQIEELKKLGMQVTTKVDTARFQATLAPAYADFAKKFGQANIDRIKNHKF